MTHKEMMNIKYETCDLWNSLKDKSKIVDTLIDLKEQNLKLKAELEELKKNAIIRPAKYKAKLGTVYWSISDYGEIFDIQADSPTITNFRWKMGNMFATKSEAEEALKKLEEV